MSLELFLSDWHLPFEDATATALMLKVVRKLQPDLIWLGGDILDFYAVSRYDKKPIRKLQLQDELDHAATELRRLRHAAKDARMVYQIGNHEERFIKYLWGKAPELSVLNCLSFPELLNLNSIETEFVDHARPVAVGQLWHMHGHMGPGGMASPARNKMQKFATNTIAGHHHRMQVEYKRTLEGKTIGSWLNGCLCSMEPEYDLAPNWQHGITLVRYTKKGKFHVDQLVFWDAKNGGKECILDGKLLAVDEVVNPRLKSKATLDFLTARNVRG